MRKSKVVLKVFKEDQGYSASGEVGDKYMMTMGETFEQLQEMVLECVNLTFEDVGLSYTTEEIKLEPDLPSFFCFYKVVNTREFSHRVGIDQALLSQYIKGTRKPTLSHRRKILKGIHKLGKELAEIEFLTST